ncbi:MAG: CTP synthase [Mycoplasma sp.]
MKTKIIVVTGGVYSSLGKGIIASSLGCILKHGGFSVAMLKLDPYLNTDPGLLNPLQHGEVFITEDGQKADLDLGHYERFTGLNLTSAATWTSGKLYTELLRDELEGKYDGATVQVVPHFTGKIIEKIEYAVSSSNDPDFLVIEIGGTVGDIEGLPYIEALRIFHAKNNNVLFVHCSPLFQLSANDEVKTKPTQNSVKSLRNLGITPSFLVLRYKDMISDYDKTKLSWTCDIKQENIFVSKDCQYLYEVPKVLFDQGIHISLMKHFGIEEYKFNMIDWDNFLESIFVEKSKKVNICICGKYTELNDSYLSLIESLKISGYKNKVDVDFKLLASEDLTESNHNQLLSEYDGFIIPDGSGERGVKQLEFVAKHCVENKKPCLGIKLGMKVMLDYLNSKSNFTNEIISKETLPNWCLGNKEVKIANDSLANKIYSSSSSFERHWSSWVLNTDVISLFKDVIISGTSTNNGIEIIELKDHPFFVGTLFHPEYSSKPSNPHKIFDYFIKSI